MLGFYVKGNAFTDIGSPHYKAHASLEVFWNQFRKGGSREFDAPTNIEYSKAVADSLRAAGLSPSQVNQAVRASIRQRVQHGLLGSDKIQVIPGRLNQTQ